MKKTITLVMILALCLSGCGAKPGPSQVISNVSAEDCFLCGGGAGEPFYWGQNNVGIINLNTFEVMPIMLNRYDDHRTLIEKSTGCLTCRWLYSGENKLCAHVYEDADRGYASGSIKFNKDNALDWNSVSAFLCQACLDSALSKIYEKGFGAGIINFSTREIRPLEVCSTGFGLGDYYIYLNWKETKDPLAVDIFVSYCPLRYDEEE